MRRWHRVVPLAELASPAAREFALGTGDWPIRGFVVRTAEGVAAWRNRCPHAGHPLNLLPDRFLTRDGRWLVCSSHGAVFGPMDGVCVAGPCPGQRLSAIEVKVDEAGWVCVRPDEADPPP